MKEITIALDDDNLAMVEAEAATSGRSIQDILVEALQEWLADVETDQQERAEIDAARREYQARGGVEAHEFFDQLRRQE